MARSVRWLLGVSLFLFIIGGPFAYAKYRKATMRNFREVEDGVLYRSGQLSLDSLKRVRHDYGIKTVITLLRRQGRERRPTPPRRNTATGKRCTTTACRTARFRRRGRRGCG